MLVNINNVLGELPAQMEIPRTIQGEKQTLYQIINHSLYKEVLL